MSDFNGKDRIIQEYVPGKQITLAHLIAHPGRDLCQKIGVQDVNAIGIMTLTPGESSIIAGDIAIKAADIKIGFLDRFSGALVFSGEVGAVEESLNAVIRILSNILNFTPCEVTRT